MEDHHTHCLGQATDGRLFWAYDTFIFTKPRADFEEGDDWRKFRREYAIIHTFDKDGNYLATKHWDAGLTIDIAGKSLEEKLQEFVSELGDTAFKDIEVKLFQTEIDGITFGLIPDEESEMIHLQPTSKISFQEPWDGEYYT
jgi:formate hydrogenlyase regulatory protein HycA